MVEGAALEMLYRGNSIEGSNPSLSVARSGPRGRVFFAIERIVAIKKAPLLERGLAV